MYKKIGVYSLVALAFLTQAHGINDGFNFGSCNGSGSFEQQINHYNGDYENAITVGDIPEGIIGLHITLESDKDVDIRLYAGEDKIVHWPYGLLKRATEQTKPYLGTPVTYSGYNGVGGEKGHEFITVEGATPAAMTMKAFGYQAGFASVSYSWTDKVGCETATGNGTFTQDINKDTVVTIGEIPAGIQNLSVSLSSVNDLDIQLYGEDGTAIIAWPGGLLEGPRVQDIDYHNMHIEWSGYNGIDGQKGNEYIRITGETSEKLTMKAFGYKSGLAEVVYSWDPKDTNTTYTFDNSGFENPLNIPALAASTVEDGTRVFHMYIQEGTTQFMAGVDTQTYGINSDVLGETIRMHNGEQIKIMYHNNLNEPTTMHGHGMHVPAVMDGGPKSKILPGTTWTAEYTVNQRASTNWYHPHLMGKTAEHVYRGLAGIIIIDDNQSDTLDLPKRYGIDDIPVILQDKRFDANGQIDYSPSNMELRQGYKSETMLANGVITPHIDVEAKQIRFRLVNASNARVYRLAFSDARSFKQIATDNSFLQTPAGMNEVHLTVGERAEIIVDFREDIGKDIVLKDLNSGFDIMKINVAKVATTQHTLPENLTQLTIEDPNNAQRTRKFMLGMSRIDGQMHMTINGKIMDMARIDEVVPVNDVEIWEITNTMGMAHNFHIHATHFYPLERDGSAENIMASEKGYKDVIHVGPNSTVKVLVKMTDFVDDENGYMYHCHFLEHEDDGMMGQFTVTNGEAVINVGGTTGGMGNNNTTDGMNNNNPNNMGN